MGRNILICIKLLKYVGNHKDGCVFFKYVRTKTRNSAAVLFSIPCFKEFVLTAL